MIGEERTLRIHRAGVAIVACFDAVILASMTLSHRLGADRFVGDTHPLRGVANSPVLVLALAATSIALGVWFARAPNVLWPGALLLVSLRLQHETHCAATGMFEEAFYHSGAALLGWILGTAVAWSAGARPTRDAPERLYIERLASIGALAMLAATWVTAGVCKVRASSVDWVSSDTLRLVAVIHARPGHDLWRSGLAEWLIESPRLASALSGAALIVELGAFVVLLGPRARLVWSPLIVGFHVGTFLFAGIFFAQAVALLILLGFPFRAFPEGERWEPPAAGRSATRLLGVTAAVCVATWLAPIRMREHPLIASAAARAAANAAAVSAEHEAHAPSSVPLPRLGPLANGTALALGFSVHAIELRTGIVRIEARDATGGALVFELAPAGVKAPRGPFDAGTASLSVRKGALGPEVYEPVGRALAEQLRKGAGSVDVGVALGTWAAPPR